MATECMLRMFDHMIDVVVGAGSVFIYCSKRAVPVNRGLYRYIKNLMSQNNKTFHIIFL